jgi:hypothetical protein
MMMLTVAWNLPLSFLIYFTLFPAMERYVSMYGPSGELNVEKVRNAQRFFDSLQKGSRVMMKRKMSFFIFGLWFWIIN